MAQEYKIVQVSQQEPKKYEGQYGTTYYIKVKLEGVEEPIEIGKKQPNSLKVGDTVYGTITETEFGKKFKAEKNPNGFGGGRQPAKNDESMYRTSALKNATEYAYTKGLAWSEVPQIADVFYGWLKGNGGVGEQKSLKEQWNNTLASKENATTPPVDAYKDVVAEVDENEEINLDDIPF